MYDETLLVVTCEVVERLLAIRSLVDDPTYSTRGPSEMVARVLHVALDGVAAELGGTVVPALSVGRIHSDGEAAELLALLSRLGVALRSIHERLGYLGRRWVHSAPDIVARKLREDGATLTPSAVCLSDEYDCLDHDMAGRLRSAMIDLGIPVREADPLAHIVLLPRCEAGNPLAWTLLLGPLSRLAGRGHTDHPEGGDEELQAACCLEARLGGPASLAAAAAHALFMAGQGDGGPGRRLSYLETYTAPASSSLVLKDDQQSFFQGHLVALYSRVLREQATLLRRALPGDGAAPETDLDGVALPSSDEAGALLAKLDDGIPINAISATLSPDFGADLDACDDSASFYRLLGHVAERPASLATILTMGWLYKAQRSYALFRDLVQGAGHGPGSFDEIMATYNGHMATRGLLLQQSIEAAYVHQIFAKWAHEG